MNIINAISSSLSWLLGDYNSPNNDPMKQTEPFTEKDWTRFGFTEKAPPISKSLQLALDNPCPFFPKQTIRETHKLIYLPQNISPDDFRKLLGYQREPHFFDVHGKTKVKEGYWFLITKRPVPNSFFKSFQDQQNLLPKGYRPPHIIEAIVATSISKIKNESEIFPERHYTRCIEKTGTWPIAIGSTMGELDITYCDWNDFNGIAAVRTQ